MVWFNVFIFGIVEGITEFLPVSSMGHLILFHRWFQLSPESSQNAFDACIQLGTILAVVVLYFWKLNLLAFMDQNGQVMTLGKRRKITELWARVLVGVLLAMILGLLFDDLIDQYPFSTKVVVIILVVWGTVIILMGKQSRPVKSQSSEEVPYSYALGVGFFQCLVMVPGTSRLVATIIGATALGLKRVDVAEFSFFLAIPTILGATFLKVVKNFHGFGPDQWLMTLLGGLVSFVTAYLVIKVSMGFIGKHDFVPFGIYRTIVGIPVSILFL